MLLVKFLYSGSNFLVYPKSSALFSASFAASNNLVASSFLLLSNLDASITKSCATKRGVGITVLNTTKLFIASATALYAATVSPLFRASKAFLTATG